MRMSHHFFLNKNMQTYSATQSNEYKEKKTLNKEVLHNTTYQNVKPRILK